MGRRVDDLAGRAISQDRPRLGADVRIGTLDHPANLGRHASRNRQSSLLQQVEAVEHRVAAAQGLLGRGIGLPLRTISEPEEAIGGRDDVLDLGAGLGLEQRNRVEQHRLVGDQLARDAQLGQRRVGADASSENLLCLHLSGRRQVRQLVMGLARNEVHDAYIAILSKYIDFYRFFHHILVICRSNRHTSEKIEKNIDVGS